jgi:hypothetical protein
MVTKFNSKTHLWKKMFSFFYPFLPHLHSKFVKSTNMIKFFFFKKAIWVVKNAEFDADFESIEKVSKKLMRKKLSTKP